MLKIFFFLNALIVCPIYGQSVDSLQPLNNKIKDSAGQLKHSLSPIFNKAIDSSFISVRQMEERFQNQLFSNDLFTALNDSIENQSVEVVYYPELSTDTLKKRLAILDAKTPFNIEYNPSLENVIKRHLKSRKTSTETLMRLSRYYFPMFEEVLDKYNLPLEIKYLAIVESSLKPRAKSRAGATGLWQFMFSTGKHF